MQRDNNPVESPSRDTNSAISAIREKRLKLLIVDDDDAFRRSMRFHLQRVFDAQVDDVGSGLEAVRQFATGNSYDIIFLDIKMPQQSGIETYHQLRKMNDKVQIVIMSGYSN